jgi:transcriptional regulator GlxA family with amidase domain
MATYDKRLVVRRHSSSRRIVVVVVPPVDELDLVGPLQVFNSVNRLAARNIYAIEVVTNADQLTVEGEGGVLTFMAKHRFNEVTGASDSVLLVCGMGSRSVRDAALSAWLKKMAAEVRRLGAVCVGAFLLAEAGLLNERRATTHWRFGPEMAMRYPGVRVQHDPLWVKDGNIYTSAGISAGIDLALAWVEEDCGACLAHEAARELCYFCDAREDSHN